MPTKALQTKSAHYSNENLFRSRFIIEERDNKQIIIDNKKLINFCSNDYLNIATHPTVKKAFINGINKYGAGSGASNLISGYYLPHHELEEKFAEFLGRNKAILFNSGYHANLGVITTLANRNNIVIADQFCHASIIDSMVLSRTKYYRYNHNDLHHAEKILSRQTKIKEKLLITEGVFSTGGNLTPLDDFTKLAKKYNATTIVDDAHGFGVLGSNGKGSHELYSLDPTDISYLVTPLGKAFASIGAIVSGDKEFIKPLVQFARTYVYTTSLPPAVSYAGLAILKIISKENWRRKKIQYLINFFIKQATLRNLPITSYDPTPIKSILIGDNKTADLIQKKLFGLGYFVSCIRPPTVPKNKAQIRISLNCDLTEADIINLLDNITEQYEQNNSR